MSEFFDAWELFREPTLAGTLAGALLGVLGVYVVLRRLVFLTAAVSQVASFGVTVALWLGLQLGSHGEEPAGHGSALSPWMVSVALCLMAVWGVAVTGPADRRQRRDAWLGALWVAGAAGTLILATRVGGELSDVQTLVFGSAVAITEEDYTRILWLAVGGLGLHAWWARGFLAATFDPAGARVRGVPVGRLDLVLFGSIAVALATVTSVLGALPTFAMSVLPAVAALALAPSAGWALLVAGVVGAACGFWGYVTAFGAELPVGASQAGLTVGAVAVALPLGAALRWRRARRRQPELEHA